MKLNIINQQSGIRDVTAITSSEILSLTLLNLAWSLYSICIGNKNQIKSNQIVN